MEAAKPGVQVVADLILKHCTPQVMTIPELNGQPSAQVLLLPTANGYQAHQVQQYTDPNREAPKRRKGTAVLEDLASFIDHAKRFADEDSALFACPNQHEPTLRCVFDYHERTAAGKPRFRGHQSSYKFPLSAEWEAWNAKNKSPFSQTDFAEFIENRIVDVIDPGSAGDALKAYLNTIGAKAASPAKLMELSRGLTIRVDSKVGQTVNIATGETQIRYESAHSDEAGTPLSVPSAFAIAIPVFRGGARYDMPVRLRYRKQANGLTWFYELAKVDAVFDHAFAEACNMAKKDTGLPLFMGQPE